MQTDSAVCFTLLSTNTTSFILGVSASYYFWDTTHTMGSTLVALVVGWGLSRVIIG